MTQGTSPAAECETDRTRPNPLPNSALSTAADTLTAARLAMIPVLWLVAVLGLPVYLGIGVAIASATDVLDGFLARRSRRSTAFGSRWDSIADHLLSASLLIWLLWFRPEFFWEQRTLLALWIGVAVIALLVGWIKFRRIGDLHLYSAKLAAVLGYLFGIYLLIVGTYSRPVFYLVVGVCIVAAAEMLFAMLTCSRVDEHLGSVIFPRRHHRATDASPVQPEGNSGI